MKSQTLRTVIIAQVLILACNTRSSAGVDLIRHYTFDEVSTTQGIAACVAGEAVPLKYQGKDPLQVIQGRKPGSKAVRLDNGCFQGAAFALKDNTFTLLMWYRSDGQGAQLGNGNKNGMLFAQGDGYWHGLRVRMQNPSTTLRFEIGRPQPSSAFGISAREPAPLLGWHHLATVWDGRVMRLYLDGLPHAAGRYEGAYTPPNGPLKIGYAGAGVGSLKLDVDDVMIFNRALNAGEILRYACETSRLTEEHIALFSEASDALAARQFQKAHDAYNALIADATLHAPCQAAACRALGRVRRAQFPSAPAMTNWDLALQSVHALRLTGNLDSAMREHETLLKDAAAPAEVKSIACLTLGHDLLSRKRCAPAIKAFQHVLKLKQAPAHHRREAQESIQEAKRLQLGLPARDPEANRHPSPIWPKPAITLYVAPTGSDDNPGTLEKPFATLEAVRDALRGRKQGGVLPAGGATVFIRKGLHPRRDSFRLTEADTGTASSPIVYRASPGEKPLFSGGVTLSGFMPVADAGTLARLPEAARGKVMSINLKDKGITDFGSLGRRGFGCSGYPAHPWVDLYANGKALQLARWPNKGAVQVGRVLKGGFGTPERGGPGAFSFSDKRLARWKHARDIWAFGAWGYLWEGCCVKITAVDAGAGRITTGNRTSYGYRAGQPFYFFNLLEELDAPGEWYLDRDSGELFVYPPENMTQKALQVDFPLLSTPFVVMDNAAHVSLVGLVFKLGRAEGAVIRGGQGNQFARCTFRQLGTNGAVIQGGKGHGLLGCDLEVLGAGGVRLSGGELKSLTPGGHFVENCHIHNFSRIDRVYAPAVHVDGVGHRIAHNLFHHSPHHGMRVEGFEHRIEYNEIHSVVYEFDDQSGIDMFGNPAYRGNEIRYNFWHHIGSGHNVAGQSGIRLDDFISGTLLYGNVFYRCAGGRFGGIQIHGGKDNMADNNLFIDCRFAFSFSPWGGRRWLERLSRPGTQAAIQRGGMDITKPPFSTRYPDLARMKENPDRNYIWRNLAVRCGQFSTRDRGVNEYLDNHAIQEDPGFAGPARRDFSLPPDAPIYRRFGFRPIPFGEIGLYEDAYRASWPVHHTITPHYVAE